MPRRFLTRSSTPSRTAGLAISRRSPECCHRPRSSWSPLDRSGRNSVLQLLTDEHISPAVALQAPRRCRGIHIRSIQAWEGGHFLGVEDDVLLTEARRQKLTVVTFDLRTIVPLLRLWAEQT